MSAPTIPKSNMKEGDKIPPIEANIEDEEEQQIPPVVEGDDTPPPDENKEKEVVVDPDEKEVSFNDFLKEKGEGVLSGIDGKGGKEKEKEKPTAKEIIAGKETVDDKGKETEARDYSGLTEEETKLLKKAGNETFAYVKPILLEHKQLKENLEAQKKELADLKQGKVTYPDSIYEHEQAYVLTPEFNRINNDKVTAEAVLTHWQRQAVLIRKGKDWQDIEDDGKGNMRLSAPKPATDEDEAAVNNNIAFAQRQLSQQEKIYDDFVGGFKNRHQADVAAIKNAEAKYFTDYDKPDHITAGIQKETLEALPASLRKNPLAPLVCKLVGAAKLLQFRYDQLSKQKDKTTKIEEIEKKNGPKGDETLGGGGKVTKTPSFSDFNKAKE